jgi:hypothetical protein
MLRSLFKVRHVTLHLWTTKPRTDEVSIPGHTGRRFACKYSIPHNFEPCALILPWLASLIVGTCPTDLHTWQHRDQCTQLHRFTRYRLHLISHHARRLVSPSLLWRQHVWSHPNTLPTGVTPVLPSYISFSLLILSFLQRASFHFFLLQWLRFRQW